MFELMVFILTLERVNILYKLVNLGITRLSLLPRIEINFVSHFGKRKRTFMCRPGSSSTSCRAISLQDFLDGMGTFPSSSQYRLGECAYNADGVAWVILVLVTTPVDLPVNTGK